MKILYITTFYDESGGAELLIKELENHFSEKHSITTISVMPSKKVFSPNSSYAINIDKTKSEIIKHVESNDYDFIHIFLGHSFLLDIAISLKSMNETVILHVIDPWFTFPYFKNEMNQLVDKDFIKFRNKFPASKYLKAFIRLSALEKMMEDKSNNLSIHNFADKVITCSSDITNYFLKRHNAKTNEVKTIPLYIRNTKKALQILDTNSIFELTFIGRVTDSWKGFTTLLKAIKGTPFHLHVFTKDTHIQKIMNIFNENIKGVDEQVVIHKNLSDKETINELKHIPIMVLPSMAEGFSFAMVESMALGKIVIHGCKFGGPLDIVKDNFNGFVFDTGDFRSLKNKLSEISNSSPKTLLSISKNAISTSKRYTKAEFFKKIDKVYKEI